MTWHQQLRWYQSRVESNLLGILGHFSDLMYYHSTSLIILYYSHSLHNAL